MNFFSLVWTNFKRNIKSKPLLIGCVLAPIVVTTLMTRMFSANVSKNVIYLVNNDKGSYGQLIVDNLNKNSEVKVLSKEDGVENVKNKKTEVCYEIQDDFTDKIKKGEKPEIKEYRRNNSNSRYLEVNMLDDYVNKLMLSEKMKQTLGEEVSVEDLSKSDTSINELNPNNKDLGDAMLINFVISFVLFCSMGIIAEIGDLREQNIFRRAFATGNSKRKIIGSFLTALLIQQTITYILIFILVNYINGLDSLDILPIISVNIFVLVFLSLGIGTFVTKVIKDDRLSPIIVNIVVSLTCFVGGAFLPYEMLPEGIKIFSKFTPQYWAIQSINTGKYEYALVVSLFAIVIFLAGTYNFDKSLEN